MNLTDVYRKAKSPVRPFVRRRWNKPPFSTAASLAERYLRIWSNGNHNLHTNGEADLLRHLGPLGLSTVLDVGCHVGSWTDQALASLPGVTVHAFEADPRLAADLTTKYRGNSAVVVNASGMADESGTHVLFVNPDARDISSMVDDGKGLPPVEVPVVRGDEYCEQQGIEVVDFLKIDTEGFDFNVLSGFDSMFGPALRIVQFEYNEWNAKGRRLLADFYDLLEPHGYRIGKVHLNGVDFRPYRVAAENWVGPACVAVHDSAADAARAIAVR